MTRTQLYCRFGFVQTVVNHFDYFTIESNYVVITIIITENVCKKNVFMFLKYLKPFLLPFELYSTCMSALSYDIFISYIVT